VGRRFDAILFDAGGVLVLPDPTVLGPLLAPYGADGSYDRHHRAHYAAMRIQDTAGVGLDDWGAYDAAYVEALGVSGDEAAEAAQLLGNTRTPMLWRYPIRGASNALRSLVDAEVPIGIVSNASGQIEQTLRRFRLCQVGDGDCVPVACVVDSEVVGVTKPDPAIFGFALDVLGLAAHRVAYVGDSVRNDVRGAQAAGLTALHLDPYDDHPDAEHERVGRLSDLLEFV
jgi:putative hydrolase of the HAD superfamily